MKKRKVITAVLLVAFLLMGASYAAWSDTLVLDHNVTTGTLDVDWTTNTYDLGYPDTPFVLLSDDDNLVDPSCTINVDYTLDDFLSITINNMYPGVYAAFDIHQQNMGTLPAKFSSVIVNTAGSTQGALDNIIYSTSLYILRDGAFYYIDSFWGPVTDVEAFLSSNLAGVVLGQADGIFVGDVAELFSGELLLPLSALDDAQGQTLNFEITFTWVQP